MFESWSMGTYEFDDLGLYYRWRCGYIYCYNDNINAPKYIEIVDNLVWPLIAHHFPDDNYTYQDDNAPVHRARIVMEYFKQNQMHGMEWPAQSPDHYIIENVWRENENRTAKTSS